MLIVGGGGERINNFVNPLQIYILSILRGGALTIDVERIDSQHMKRRSPIVDLGGGNSEKYGAPLSNFTI